jgi:hypothetical protein
VPDSEEKLLSGRKPHVTTLGLLPTCTAETHTWRYGFTGRVHLKIAAAAVCYVCRNRRCSSARMARHLGIAAPEDDAHEDTRTAALAAALTGFMPNVQELTLRSPGMDTGRAVSGQGRGRDRQRTGRNKRGHRHMRLAEAPSWAIMSA